MPSRSKCLFSPFSSATIAPASAGGYVLEDIPAAVQGPDHESASFLIADFDAAVDNCYVGYFENPYGEQWIFALDRMTGKATLRGGDVGWNTSFDVVDGSVAGLILETEERVWLQAC